MARPAGAPGALFRGVFSAESSYVWNVLRRLRVREADVPDLAHEVFVILHRRMEAESLDITRPLRPWLAATAFRVASVHRRSAAERREVLCDGEEQPLLVDPKNPEALLATEQDRALVLRAIEAIDPDRRIVFILHDIDEQPMPAVAEALEIPLNTGYSRLRLARDEFRAAVRRIRPGFGGEKRQVAPTATRQV